MTELMINFLLRYLLTMRHKKIVVYRLMQNENP